MSNYIRRTPATFWENKNLVTFKNEDSYDFIAPATQDVIRKMGGPLWEPTFASRCDYPMWERPDILRVLNYRDVINLGFSSPTITYTSGVVQPSGIVTLQDVKRYDPVHVPDRDLYHHNVQKMFSIFNQFDTLLLSQIVGFSGLSVEEVEWCLHILWSQGIIERSVKWRLFDTHGYIWRMNRKNASLRAYVNGMDSVPRALTVGDYDVSNEPPGSSSRSSLRHNLFTAEFLLRACEAGDNVIGVWGDPYLSESMFHEHDPNALLTRRSHADGAIVTKDGVVILIETISRMQLGSSVDQNTVDKAASWVGVIANSPIDLRVIFVDTTFYHSHRVTLNSINIALKKESHKFAPDVYSRERAMSHIGVTGAPLWYGENGALSQAGTRLVTYVPHTRSYKEFDLPDERFSTPSRRRDIVVNTVSALHTPPWIMGDIKERDYATC